jgi:hypothetical protein
MDFTKLIAQYIRDQWVNHRKALNEPQAREELLGSAQLRFYRSGTKTPVNSYSDEDLVVPHCHPVIANQHGDFPPVFIDSGPTSLDLSNRHGDPILKAENARVYFAHLRKDYSDGE